MEIECRMASAPLLRPPPSKRPVLHHYTILLQRYKHQKCRAQVIASPVASFHTSTMSPTTALEAQISTQLDTYIAAFNLGSYTTAASNYHEPAVSISAQGVSILPLRKDLAYFLSGTVERLKKDGFDHSEWAGPKKIIVLDEGLVLASCGCKRLRKDGTSCEEFTATYTLRKSGEGWLIAAIHHHPLETQLK
jgi:hypothetical protein